MSRIGKSLLQGAEEALTYAKGQTKSTRSHKVKISKQINVQAICLYLQLNMKFIRIGIMTQKEIRERTLAIARGEYKPSPNEPKVWLTSIRSLAKILSILKKA